MAEKPLTYVTDDVSQEAMEREFLEQQEADLITKECEDACVRRSF